MRPLVIRGSAWRVVRVYPGDPFLIDRTGSLRVATTDAESKTIRISEAVMPPMLDRVYLHEAAHATMEEAGVPDLLPAGAMRVYLEELIAWFLETHAIEVVDAVSASLGRPACVDGTCLRRLPHGDSRHIAQ